MCKGQIKSLNSSRGMTLVELIVVMVILGMLAGLQHSILGNFQGDSSYVMDFFQN